MPFRIAQLLILAFAGVSGQPEGDESLLADEKLLRTHNIGVDGSELLRFVRVRTPSQTQQQHFAGKIQQLGDVSYQARVQAGMELIKAGKLARPFLLETARDPAANLEITRRAELCLRQMSADPEIAQTAAVLRLLGKRRPDGAAAALIDYLPFIHDAEVVESAQAALNLLAVGDDMKPEPAVLAALKDARAHVRGAAAESLIRGGGLVWKPLVEPMLRDVQPQVRFQLALALLEKRDRAVLPELIGVLGVLSAEQTWPAEEILHRLAGENGPDLWLGRKNGTMVREQWQTWWAKNQGSVNLEKLDDLPRFQGLTVLAQLGKGVAGKIVEIGPSKEIRWQIEGLQYPVDVQVIGPNRVLIAEYLGRRVTERDFQGKVYWERSIDLPISCQRLSGGRTFIATRRQVLILSAAGKEVFTHNQQNTSIAAATCAPDGHVYMVSSGGLFQKFNAEGREVKTFQVGYIYTLGANLDVLPGGRILVPQYRDNKVAEYDASGKIVWEAKVSLPTSAVRLANGHTLVTTSSQMRVVELDRRGEVVWEYPTDSRPLRARKR